MCYAQFSSLISALLTIFIGIFFGLLAKYKPGRYLLEKYPRFFSMGTVSKQGPTKRMAENTNFEMKIFGRGKMKNIYLKHWERHHIAESLVQYSTFELNLGQYFNVQELEFCELEVKMKSWNISCKEPKIKKRDEATNIGNYLGSSNVLSALSNTWKYPCNCTGHWKSYKYA